MTVINTNVGALTARTYAVKATKETETAMERLSSGLRINSAADDAAGLAVANKMESQLRGMNMAIRNSQDGISLVQTAEAAMGEINNMAIRMRELAVQMNNGVYTDSDRTNAQLEVTALLAEIDKIATNAAFNEVKILDGTYSKDIRAGNTNPEIINVTIDRMNTDSLGGANLAGTTVTATNANSTDVDSAGRTSINAVESSEVKIKSAQLGTGIQTFASTNSGGTYSLAGDDASSFTIDASTGEITASSAMTFDDAIAANNVKSLEVTYTASGGTSSYTDNLTVNITENTSTAVVKSTATSLSANESANLSFRAVNSLDNPATDGMLSDSLQSFVTADTNGGTFALTGTDAGDFSIDANTGVVTASLNHESASDSDTNNEYSFNVVYTSSTGDKFTEAVTLTVNDTDEEVHSTAFGTSTPTTAEKGSTFTVVADDTTVTATVGDNTAGSVTTQDLVDMLNAANTALGANAARGTFSVDATDDEKISFTFNDSVGAFAADSVGHSSFMSDFTFSATDNVAADTTDAQVTVTTGTDKVNEVTTVSGISGALNSTSTGDTFSIVIDSTTLTATVGAGETPGTFSVTDLANSLNSANSALGTPLNINFGTDNADLTITGTGAMTSFTATSFERNSSTVGTVTETTAHAAAVAHSVTFDFAGGDADAALSDAASTAFQETFEVTLGGVDYSVTTASTATSAGDLASKLNANSDFSALYTASSTGDELTIEANTAGASNNFTMTDARFRLEDDNITSGTADSLQDGVSSLANAGVVNADRSASTDAAATADLNGSFATSDTSKVTEAKNTINVKEANVITFGTDAMSSSLQNYMTTAGQTGGTFAISGTDASSFEINSNSGVVNNKVNMDADGSKTSYTFDITYTDKNGETFTDKVTMNLSDDATDNVQHIADVDLSTQGGAASAIAILDSAINQISGSQAKLGAIQNRLDHNIDNLSMASMLTETSRGRIVDADFARETSNLSKQQILAQAATSMLAQANQSKQSVLSLLQ